MPYLFQVNIGPVQDFIASARRSRDLFFGSWLLSELSKAAAKRIVDDNELKSLIFPAPTAIASLDPGSELNAANKIVARITQDPNTMGQVVYEAIMNRLHEIRKEAFAEIDHFNRKEALEQIDGLVEYYWAAVELDDSDYANKRQKLEALMAARKNTRDFKRVTWGSEQPKSSIDGQLESVIPESRYARRNASDAEKSEKAKILFRQYKAGPAERLSGVDLLKRRGEPIPKSYFPSTSHIATIPFLDRLEQINGDYIEDAMNKWNMYIKAVDALSDGRFEYVSGVLEDNHKILGNLEGSLLFEERWRDLLEGLEKKDKDSEQVKKVKNTLQDFYKYVDEQLGKARPDAYYALLHADGDHMGKAIDHFAGKDYKPHQKISQQLDAFAGGVRNIIKVHQGTLVYSGGDDVLAFLPLHTALQCAKELADDFRKKLSEFPYEAGKSPTLSVGLVIVHHLHPLSDVLNLARSAEKKAKDAGRNALAITVSKRSGGEFTTTGHWDAIDGQLEKLIEYTDTIPSGTAYELQAMVQRLSFATDDTIVLNATEAEEKRLLQRMLQEAIQAETRRILQRKLKISEEKIRKEPQDKAVQAYLNLLTMVGIALPKLPENTVFSPTVALIDGKQPSDRIERLISMLLVARIFADAQKLAKAEKSKGGGQ